MSTKAPAKPASKAVGKAEPGDFWAQIDSRQKPGRAVSTDGMRPVLNNAYVRHEKGGSYLYATNSYLLVALPIQMDCPSKERKKLLPEVGLDREALSALDKSTTGKFRVRDGLIEVDGTRALFPVAEEEGINYRKLLDENPLDGADAEGSKFGVNPRFLQQVSEALGSTRSGVAIHFRGPMKAVRVVPLGTSGEGLLMPIRLDV